MAPTIQSVQLSPFFHSLRAPATGRRTARAV
jgi:hypothetical protein